MSRRHTTLQFSDGDGSDRRLKFLPVPHKKTTLTMKAAIQIIAQELAEAGDQIFLPAAPFRGSQPLSGYFHVGDLDFSVSVRKSNADIFSPT